MALHGIHPPRATLDPSFGGGSYDISASGGCRYCMSVWFLIHRKRGELFFCSIKNAFNPHRHRWLMNTDLNGQKMRVWLSWKSESIGIGPTLDATPTEKQPNISNCQDYNVIISRTAIVLQLHVTPFRWCAKPRWEWQHGWGTQSEPLQLSSDRNPWLPVSHVGKIQAGEIDAALREAGQDAKMPCFTNTNRFPWDGSLGFWETFSWFVFVW